MGVAARTVQISLTASQRAKFAQAMERDIAWLSANRLMDYSLLVAVKEGGGPCTGKPSPRGTNGNGNKTMVHLAIIDYLQKWTNGKRVARFIKVLETNKATVPPNVYGSRFQSHLLARVREIEDTGRVG